MSIRISLVKTEDTLTPALQAWRAAIPERVTDVMKAYAALMVEMAQSIVPVRTGFLQSTIQCAIAEIFHVIFEATAPYAAYVEYGTYKMAARPYMRPALEAYIPELADTLASEIVEIFTG
ncbi:HK97 gp10 family phage protein [Candidatus Bathyarchaeota archaeon]|nr:HK97 gp10 family phage protein [Candidatus Bathyarchaeota archaeon]